MEKIENYTRNERKRCEIKLETIGKDVKLNSKRVEIAEPTLENLKIREDKQIKEKNKRIKE